MQELDKVMGIIDGDNTSKNVLKEGQLHLMVMDGLRNVLGMFLSSRGKGGGR